MAPPARPPAATTSASGSHTGWAGATVPYSRASVPRSDWLTSEWTLPVRPGRMKYPVSQYEAEGAGRAMKPATTIPMNVAAAIAAWRTFPASSR